MRYSTCLTIVLFVLSILTALDCSATKQGVTISVSPEMVKSDTMVSAAWFSYGINKALWQTSTFFDKNPGKSTYEYTLSEEVECRNQLSDTWLEMKEKNGLSNKYLDELSAVVKAGFITEYVWKYLRQPNWTPPTELHENAFESWVQENLINHKCITMTSVLSKAETNLQTKKYKYQQMLNKAVSNIGKGNFRTAEALLREIADNRPANWRTFYESNDSLYYAFWSPEELQRYQKQNSGKTVVPLFPSFSRVHYFLGFIKLEEGDAEGALLELNKAADLQPNHTMILLEKGTVLSYLKQPAKAFECFELAEKPHFTSTDLCLAQALRGQGILLIDMGKLDDAELCFEKSLKYDSASNVALNELEYIRRLRSGQATPDTQLEINNKIRK